jgi:dGTPase
MTDERPPSPRQRYESAQDRWLAACAVRERDSGGRTHDEPPHPYRTCFQRDRDRIVHCSAFRRLDYKTQVFVPHEQDHFRTRLTHTLEVAQVGRSIGRALQLNEDLIEAVALAHDLGHAPYGHVGENMLDELMEPWGGFEHNLHSLRVVDYLEHPYPAFRGLNLTTAVRECLARHETRYDAPACEEFPAGQFAPLEGQVVDLADEIAYTSADLEDALGAGWITAEQLREIPLWREAWRVAETDAPDARDIHKQIRADKALLGAMVTDAIDTSGEAIERGGLDSPVGARTAEAKCVLFSAAMRRDVEQMQDFLLHEVYRHPNNVPKRTAARAMLEGLFVAYTSDPDTLPARYRKRIDADGLQRVACDYIAGMTDRFCRKAHAALGA